MKGYAWYSPELDTIVIQLVTKTPSVVFEYDLYIQDLIYKLRENGGHPLSDFLWIALGEV